MLTVASMLTVLGVCHTQIARFAATLYFRTPGALAAKQHEVAAAGGPIPGLGAAVGNVYEFTNRGFSSSIIEWFTVMRRCIIRSDSGFIASDRPCFDIDRRFTRIPAFGDELGIRDDVVCSMPLTPNWLAIFIPTLDGDNHSVRATQIPAQHTEAFNQLVRDKAHRWVVEIQR